jgi:hypothetical protein
VAFKPTSTIGQAQVGRKKVAPSLLLLLYVLERGYDWDVVIVLCSIFKLGYT